MSEGTSLGPCPSLPAEDSPVPESPLGRTVLCWGDTTRLSRDDRTCPAASSSAPSHFLHYGNKDDFRDQGCFALDFFFFFNHPSHQIFIFVLLAP